MEPWDGGACGSPEDPWHAGAARACRCAGGPRGCPGLPSAARSCGSWRTGPGRRRHWHAHVLTRVSTRGGTAGSLLACQPWRRRFCSAPEAREAVQGGAEPGPGLQAALCGGTAVTRTTSRAPVGPGPVTGLWAHSEGSGNLEASRSPDRPQPRGSWGWRYPASRRPQR